MNVEAAVIGYLNDRGVSAYADAPSGVTRFVTVERTGSAARHDSVDNVTLAIQCWASSRVEAVALCDEVDALMREIDADGIASSSRQSYYNFRDPDSSLSRYQMVYEVTAHN